MNSLQKENTAVENLEDNCSVCINYIDNNQSVNDSGEISPNDFPTAEVVDPVDKIVNTEMQCSRIIQYAGRIRYSSGGIQNDLQFENDKNINTQILPITKINSVGNNLTIGNCPQLPVSKSDTINEGCFEELVLNTAEDAQNNW